MSAAALEATWGLYNSHHVVAKNEALDLSLSHCQRNDVTTIMGFIFGHNSASLALFHKFGFERWGFCPQIAELDNVKRDLVILGKQLRAD